MSKLGLGIIIFVVLCCVNAASTAINLDCLTTPLTKAYERYLQACKEKGIEPD